MTEGAGKTVRVVIEGQVQGVWFRVWARQEALRLGLDGWVRNRADGSVEALLAGPAAVVDEMLSLCRIGPPMATVEAVHVKPAEPPSKPGFRTRRTA